MCEHITDEGVDLNLGRVCSWKPVGKLTYGLPDSISINIPGGVERKQAVYRMSMEGGNCFSSISSNCPNCVYLYNWSLFRASGSHPENIIARNGVQIALEGTRALDVFDHDKFRSGPIESRIEKCKLRTINGMNILLRGGIDQQCTHENGFPFQVINLFLTGFPYNWKHVINVCCNQLSLNASVLPASKENYARQEKDESPNSHHSRMHTGDRGTVIQIFLDAEEKKCDGKESTSKIISREPLVRGYKRGRYGSPVRLSKRLKYGNSSINGKPKVLTPSIELPEKENILKEFVSNLSMGIHTASVERKDVIPEQMHTCKETCENLDKDDHLIESDSKLLREKPSKVLVSQKDKYSVERKESVVKYEVISMKEIRELKEQIHCGISLDEAKLTQSACLVTNECGDENLTSSHFESAVDSIHQRIDKNKTEQSPAENVHLDQMKGNRTSQQQTKIIQKPVSEFPGTVCKTGKLISSDKSQTKRNRMHKSSQASRDELCGEITDEIVAELSIVTCHEDTTTAGEECKKYNLFPSDPDFGSISNEMTSNKKDGKENIEVYCLADADFEFLCTKEDISSASAGIKPTPLSEIHLNIDVNKSVKQVNNSSTGKRGKPNFRTRHADQSPKLFDTFVCYQTTMNDDAMVKCNDIDATCDTNLDQVASEIEHGMTSKDCTEIGNTCPLENGDGKEGSMQIQKTSTRTNMQTQTNKRQLQDNIPPHPRCCAHTTLEEVSKENGEQLYFRRTTNAKSSDVHFGQMKNNCTSRGQETQIQKPVSEFLGTGCKTGKLIASDKTQTDRNRNNKSSQASRVEINGEFINETIKELSDATSPDKITSISEECKSYNLSPSDQESGLIPNEITSPGENGKGQIPIKVECLEDVEKFEFISPALAKNKPTSLPANHLNNDVNKFLKWLNNSSTKKRGSSKTRTRQTDRPQKLSDTFMCYENTMNDGVIPKCNDIDASCGTNPHQVTSVIEHVVIAKDCTDIGDTCQEITGNGEKGCVQTPETSTRTNMQTQTNKKQSINNIPPPPRSRVHTTPEEVSKAFGLKTSRSGRLLVPPLAHWCNQTIAHDMDGGIIAILDASSQRDEHSGRLFFTPPKQKDAIQMQNKLCHAANENMSSRKIHKN